jgi:hypothetical protein
MLAAGRAESVTQKVSSPPVGSTSTSATARAPVGPQAARQGRAANTFSEGVARRRPHHGVSAARASTATPPGWRAAARASSALATAVMGRRGAEAQAGELDGAGGCGAPVDGKLEGTLAGQAVGHQLAPDA